jgi:hypothetical protein
METPMGSREVPASQRESVLRELKRDHFFVVQHADDAGFSFSSAGSETLGGVEAQILDVNADGAEVRWWIDPATGHILRASSRTLGMGGGPTLQVVDYSDFRPVAGVVAPFKQTITRDGQEAGSAELAELEVNPAVDDELFSPPPATAQPE